MGRILFLFAAVFSFSVAPAEAAEPPPLEVYGSLPSIRSLAISPSGERIVFLRHEGEQEYAAVFDFTKNELIAAADTSNIKARGVFFISDDYAILRVSQTERMYGFRGEFEYSAAFSWNLVTGEIKQLLRYEDDLFPAQSGLGRIVGRLRGADEDYVFMPAYMGSRGSEPDYDLLRVKLSSGSARTQERGYDYTRDWIVDLNGAVIAREDFDDKSDIYSIWFYKDGKPQKIYEEKTELPNISLLGVKPDRSALIVAVTLEETDRQALLALTPDGKFSEPLFSRSDADVGNVLTDLNRVVYGVRYSGLKPSYEFFDPALEDALASAQATFPEASVWLTDWTDDFETMIIRVEGAAAPPVYYLYRPGERRMSRAGAVYKGISEDQLGSVKIMKFEARDGEQISSILTLPPSGAVKGGYPTIIMPHGGPAAYDAVGFDWKAQFFASRGYAVIQPNFRGSSGFGRAFEEAGHGEWGRGVMQHDVTDAAEAAVKAGVADPERMCIVGSSYGGYAALAGGAFTPELYKCVAAIAPVADLPQMIFTERRDSGKDSWVVSYWTKVIGDVREERDRLEDMSPSNHAEAFKAPVLLIHGNDDTVVPYRQSRIMKGALERADKDVELVKVKGGDHWLTTSEMRLETLRALGDFVDSHIGDEAAAPISP
ncbi:alpha/beta hydrolase family protein [Hyphococcus luteus]|uniref:S9 family peptidase n=1 Tax=Hyphococcus luteus TaxID=2058213 RepID=A0A2S7K4T4_9PROT|nr:prolyl oligopeptidase family serine peptidase [Marinicaulis flavus]PQA87491.1 S9 family peptidase [Marinicaulis flavus]